MEPVEAIVAVTSAAAACLACDGDPVSRGGDPQLTLSPDSIVVGVFESSPLTATVRDAGGATQNVPLRYVSRDAGVVTVSADGAVRAVAVGSTCVVATLPGRQDVRDSVGVRVHADSCTGARPDSGGLATGGDQGLFGYDADAPLGLRRTVESTHDGVEVSRISFDSPDGGLVTGMM